jgi:ubiquinone/menaquinone biosynthesis C-methylase UbiE
VVSVAAPSFANPNSSCLILDQENSAQNGGAELFGTGAAYQNVYDIIIYYPQYRAATAFHMSAVKGVPSGGVVIEAGGGTGNMTKRAMDLRPDLKIFMNDFNPAMGNIATAKGVKADQLSLGPDIGDMQKLHVGGVRATDGSVDLVFSHSVLWNLTEPADFFAESARVLKKGGILSVSTIRTGAAPLGDAFVQSIRDGFAIPVEKGLITKEQAETFAQQNANVVASIGKPDSAIKSTLSEVDIARFAKQFGFEIVQVGDCYSVPTAAGPKGFFIQFQLRKI